MPTYRRPTVCGWLLSLVWLLLPVLVHAANTHGTKTESAERAHWFGDMVQPHVVEGCLPPLAPPGLSTGLVACKAYLRGPGAALVYVDQPAKAVGPLSGGDGTYWLAVHRDTASAVAGWTREPQTHYVWLQSATRPAEASDRLLVAQLTVAGGTLTASSAIAPSGLRGYPVVYVSQFTDTLGMTSAAINAAVQSLPVTGGVVYLDAGTYFISETIELGNGGPGVASTRHGVVLEGLGTANHDLTRSAVILHWVGPPGLPVVKVAGPLIGWGLKNVYIYGGTTAGAGLLVVSAQHGDVRNLTVAGHKGNGVWSTCVPTFPGWNGVTDALKNQWYNIWIWHLPPAEPGTAGLVLDSTSVACNTDFNTFYQATVWVAGVDAWGVYLGGADHNMFYNLHLGDDPVARSGVHFAYDNSAFAGWPCANNFYGLSLGNEGMTSSGTPHPTNACANQIFGMTGGDPVDFLPDLPNVSVLSVRRANQNLTLIPGRNPASSDPIGHVEIGTTPEHPRHLVPQLDALVDLGRQTSPEGAKRFRNIYLRGQVIKESRTLVGSGVQDGQGDYYVQISNTAPSTFALQTAGPTYGCGKEYVLKALGTSSVTVGAFGAETIDGSATLILNPVPGQSAVRLYSDCVNWRIIGRD